MKITPIKSGFFISLGANWEQKKKIFFWLTEKPAGRKPFDSQSFKRTKSILTGRGR
jgi:hypothetical protein